MAYGFGPGRGPGGPPFEEFLNFLSGPGGNLMYEATTRGRERQHECMDTAQEGICLLRVT